MFFITFEFTPSPAVGPAEPNLRNVVEKPSPITAD